MDAEKVTPDPKLIKSGTATSLSSDTTTGADEAPSVCNLMTRFDAVTEGGSACLCAPNSF